MTSPEPGTHPALDLDDAVHQKTRLALLTVLDEAGRATNSTVKAVTGLVGELARGVRSARDGAKAGAAE